MSTSNRSRFEAFSRDFFGLSRRDPVLRPSGAREERRRAYLDTTATALMPRAVWRGLEDYLEAASANSHTDAHRAGRDTTKAIEDSRDAIGRLVGYDPSRDVVLFTSNGATGAINFLARALFPPELRPLVKRFRDGAPESVVAAFKGAIGEPGAGAIDEMFARPLVVTTHMEHHSNLLPWMEAVGHHNVRAVDVHPEDGTLDMDHLARILREEGDRVRIVAVTGVSNVTGVINPVRDIARMAHEVGAEILVDGAQWVPHAEVAIRTGTPAEDIDYLVLSGHKMYAPGSRGALIGSLSTLEGRRCVTDLGGGMVDYVSIEDFELKDEVTAREEAGTPNIPGSIAMGLVAEMLMSIGMDTIAKEEDELARVLIRELSAVPGVEIYASTDLERVPRAGVVAFNVTGLPHGLVAAYLNDFHNIAVRNGCFCAQPYVQVLLGVDRAQLDVCADDMAAGDRRRIPGMVRASLGVYSTREDVTAFIEAVAELAARPEEALAAYRADLDGTYRLSDGTSLPTTFRVADAAASALR